MLGGISIKQRGKGSTRENSFSHNIYIFTKETTNSFPEAGRQSMNTTNYETNVNKSQWATEAHEFHDLLRDTWFYTGQKSNLIKCIQIVFLQHVWSEG